MVFTFKVMSYYDSSSIKTTDKNTSQLDNRINN